MARLQNYFRKPQFGEHYIKSQTHGIWKEERIWRSPNPAPAFSQIQKQARGLSGSSTVKSKLVTEPEPKPKYFIISLFPQIVLVL